MRTTSARETPIRVDIFDFVGFGDKSTFVWAVSEAGRRAYENGSLRAECAFYRQPIRGDRGKRYVRQLFFALNQLAQGGMPDLESFLSEDRFSLTSFGRRVMGAKC